MSIQSCCKRVNIRCHPIRSTKKKKSNDARGTMLATVSKRLTLCWEGKSYRASVVKGRSMKIKSFVVRFLCRRKEKKSDEQAKKRQIKRFEKWDLYSFHNGVSSFTRRIWDSVPILFVQDSIGMSGKSCERGRHVKIVFVVANVIEVLVDVVCLWYWEAVRVIVCLFVRSK
jgi:hypothetical protein